MSASECYYSILNVEKTATDDEIKRAYRKLAIRYHPDKNLDKKEEAEKKFKEIGEAYAVLSDEKKRRQYDQFGKAGLSAGGGAGGGGAGMHPQDAEEIFRAFFGGQDPFAMFFQEGLHGGGGGNFGSRVHVSHFGPGFTFTTFGGHPHMRARHIHQRRAQQEAAHQQQQAEHASSWRIGGGNLLLILFLLWIMGVPFMYLWGIFLLVSYTGIV